MAVSGFTSIRASLSRAKLRASAALVTAAEADPLSRSDAPNDEPIPAEHTSPEDVAPDRPEDGNETFEHEIKRIDPRHFEDTPKREAALQDDLAQSALPAPEGDPTLPTPADAPGMEVAAPGAAPAEPEPAAPAPGAEPAPGGADNGQTVFDFENGLDPASKGQLVNDWQTNVDPKLFSRHTNVLKITQQGNAATFLVQAFNADAGAKPDLATGYAADGQERGELMAHLREIFQPNGPAIQHICGVCNDFIEDQAEQGQSPLKRLKAAGSNFDFIPKERQIEGWSDSGLGRDPIWRATPYTVYQVALTIQFTSIGG